MAKIISVEQICREIMRYNTDHPEIHDNRELNSVNDYKEYMYDIVGKGAGIPKSDFNLMLIKIIFNLAREVDELKERVIELEGRNDKQ